MENGRLEVYALISCSITDCCAVRQEPKRKSRKILTATVPRDFILQSSFDIMRTARRFETRNRVLRTPNFGLETRNLSARGAVPAGRQGSAFGGKIETRNFMAYPHPPPRFST